MTVSSAKGPKEFQVPAKGPDGRDRGVLTLDAAHVDDRIRYRLLKEAEVMYRANSRVGTHQTKTRGQLAGSNKKPWRQKGTGRARAGTRKSPLWRGGGVIFGPHPRDYSYRINRKQRRLALRSAMFAKLISGKVLVLDGLELATPKTRIVADALAALGVKGRCLVGTGSIQRNLWLSVRNLPLVSVLPFGDFNARAVLEAETVVLTRDAFDRLAAGAAASE